MAETRSTVRRASVDLLYFDGRRRIDNLRPIFRKRNRTVVNNAATDH